MAHVLVCNTSYPGSIPGRNSKFYGGRGEVGTRRTVTPSLRGFDPLRSPQFYRSICHDKKTNI